MESGVTVNQYGVAERGWRTNAIIMSFVRGVWRNIMRGWEAFNDSIAFKVQVMNGDRFGR